jgi:hypothetical protein
MMKDYKSPAMLPMCPSCGGELLVGDHVARCLHCCPDDNCHACGSPLSAINGVLACTACGLGWAAAPSRDTVPEPAKREPELISEEFLWCTHPRLAPGTEPHKMDLLCSMRAGDVPKFVCAVCGDSKPVPGTQSAAAQAAAAIPVIGPIAGPVVQAIEHVIRPGKRSR